MSDYKFFADLNAIIPDIPAESIVSRTIEKNEAVNVVLFAFAPGQELSEHTAARPAMLQFITGAATLTLGEQQMEVSAGAWAYMPAHLPHSIKADTAVIMLLTITKS